MTLKPSPLTRLVALVLLAVSGVQGISPTASAQESLSIHDFSVDPRGAARVWVPFSAGSYYILLRGDQLTAIRTPAGVEVLPPATNPGQVELVDNRLPLGAPTRFYRVEQVSRAAPQDVDADGLDDVYELNRRPALDPLDPLDALSDPDNDGRPTRQEYDEGTDPFVSDLLGLPTPTFTPPNTVTTGSTIAIAGAAQGAHWVRIEGGAAIVTNGLSASGEFQVAVPLAPNKLNRLFITGVDTNGVVSAPRPFDILQDSQPPNLFIDFPTNGMTLTASNTPVAGRVGDMLSGFRGLFVWVHSSPTDGPLPTATSLFGTNSPLIAEVDVGIGPNGSYERAQVPLVEGTNILTAIATDQLGNRTIRRAEVVRVPLSGDRMLAVSGDRQTGTVRQTLAKPISVQLLRASGQPYANKIVTFDVTRSDGRLRPLDADTNRLASDWTRQANADTNGAMVIQLKTDQAGQARALWTLGSDSGRGNNRVCVMASGVNGTLFFTASADGKPASQINIGSGNNQKAEVGNFAPESLSAWVSDGLNPAAGEEVTFKVVQGGAKLLPHPDADSSVPPGIEDGSQLKVRARVTGHAQVSLQLGPQPGQNVIEASFAGNPGLPATFIAYGVSREPGRPGTFTGLILDNASAPVGGALCELTVADSKLATYSDAQGRFSFDNVPGGTGHLYVDGSTATNLNGLNVPTNTFPQLNYAVLAVPNAENSLPTPVLLPRLNPNNAKLYDGTTDLRLTVEGIDGLEMTIQANSMTLANGQRVDRAHPVVASLNQVHHDDVPMPMPDGVAPAFAWTLQPAGATFDPPIQIKYPNMSGLPPGSIAYFLSFNHDTERFEIVSSGHVTEDGASIVTDPESGLTLAGWGCNCPPYAVSGSCCYTDNPCVDCTSKSNPQAHLSPTLRVTLAKILRDDKTTTSSVAPGQTVTVAVESSDSELDIGTLHFSIVGTSAATGSAYVTPRAKQMSGHWFVSVTGKTKTSELFPFDCTSGSPAHSPVEMLRIRATSPVDCSFADSPPFAVCAHPQSFSITTPSETLGCQLFMAAVASDGLCLQVDNENRSDAQDGDLLSEYNPVRNSNLIFTSRSEVIAYEFDPIINNPFHPPLNDLQTSCYTFASWDHWDTHSFAFSDLTLGKPGKFIVHQAFVFCCNRCGAQNVVCAKSGFKITYELSDVRDGLLGYYQVFSISKSGADIAIPSAEIRCKNLSQGRNIGPISTSAGDGSLSTSVDLYLDR